MYGTTGGEGGGLPCMHGDAVSFVEGVAVVVGGACFWRLWMNVF